jgi:transcriptional regulator with GAF, ATPase, and Fis domain
MMESELFGHERGSFTGAYAQKPGLLEIAAGGTLFLDEIGEMPVRLQVKLLRVIDTKSFFRVGGVREIRVDAGFLFATNYDIRAEVERGTFRHDLYYRLSALTLTIPPCARGRRISSFLSGISRTARETSGARSSARKRCASLSGTHGRAM